MNHDRASALMNAFLDGELTNADARELQQHVDECTSCSNELAALRRFSGRLHSLGTRTAPEHLRAHVADAILNESAHQKKKPAVRWWPAYACAIVAVVLALVLWPRGNAEAAQLLQRVDSAMARSSTAHMVCRWYKPDNRREMFTQREIWLEEGKGRWDEAQGTVALLDASGIHLRQTGSGGIPASAGSIAQHPALEPMLAGIANLNAGRLEHPHAITWQGHNYEVLLARDSDKDRNALRTIVMLDPATSLPVHAEVQKQVDGRWEPEALMQFEFNKPIDARMFSL